MFALGVLVALSVAIGCGSGSGDVGSGSGVCLNLAGSAAGSARVSLSEGSGSNCAMVAVQVMVTDIDDIFAASFDVVYDTDFAQYESYSTAGSLLSSDGRTVQVLADDQPGRVTLGLSRVGAGSGGIDANGSRLMITLYFSKGSTDGGDSIVEFGNAALLGSETPPLVKNGISWVGGTFLVN